MPLQLPASRALVSWREAGRLGVRGSEEQGGAAHTRINRRPPDPPASTAPLRDAGVNGNDEYMHAPTLSLHPDPPTTTHTDKHGRRPWQVS